MSPGERLAETALAYVLGRFAVYDEKPGYCLRVVRQLVSTALELTYEEFKARYWTETVEDNTTGIPWARDMQRSLRSSPFAEAVPFAERAPGDLVFSHDMATEGHVAVIAIRAGAYTAVIENTGSQRGLQLSGCNRLSELTSWPTTQFETFRLVEP